MGDQEIPENANKYCPGPLSAKNFFALSGIDHQVVLHDIDICGLSSPKMLGLKGQDIHQRNLGWSPKNGIIKQFLKDVDWGELDYLVEDAPPDTSDEHISILQFLQATDIDGAIIVTTPQEVSLIDVRSEVNFCKKVGIRIPGVIENMRGLQQPLPDVKFMATEETDITKRALKYMKENASEMLNLITSTEVFDSSKGGAAKMCNEMEVPFLGKVPMDPQLGKADEGRSCFVEQQCGASAAALLKVPEDTFKGQGMASEPDIPREILLGQSKQQLEYDRAGRIIKALQRMTFFFDRGKTNVKLAVIDFYSI
ncbi:hypothetical protein MKW94_001455 [Papaver nudicaule]|uniref:Cytosolic Fe-S cluster assembly factor NBP35 n=1 Tax=Papaver nudicaule TaxID=74823 RepID=A0AA41RV67_PAPNU|nr:hypothetical protein [Papaver nudicaule]